MIRMHETPATRVINHQSSRVAWKTMYSLVRLSCMRCGPVNAFLVETNAGVHRTIVKLDHGRPRYRLNGCWRYIEQAQSHWLAGSRKRT